ncbi:MAG: lysophospholipid acyltransferase family protein [Bacteroidetes bacterium]|nr:lysophospholipid acyltransferase family protein [Bacteroidota bacterium]
MRFTYFLFLFFIKLLQVVPFGLLYFFSNGLYFLVYYIAGYRKKVVNQNLLNSFPDMPANKRKQLAKEFYKNLCDILLETIKGFTMSQKEIEKRYRFINPELMDDYFSKGTNVISVGAHYANWEWGIMAAATQLKHKIVSFYTPLTNTYIEKRMLENRKRFGTELVSISDVRKSFTSKMDRAATYFFGADQSPSNVKGAHWMTFLNQDTACMKGAEFFSRLYGLPVVYFDVQRVKRGYYTVELMLLEENASGTSSGEITEKYMHTLEEIIKRKPEDYLWAHRRWKHKRSSNS